MFYILHSSLDHLYQDHTLALPLLKSRATHLHMQPEGYILQFDPFTPLSEQCHFMSLDQWTYVYPLVNLHLEYGVFDCVILPQTL